MSSSLTRQVASALARNTGTFDAVPQQRKTWLHRLVAALARYTDAEFAAQIPGQPTPHVGISSGLASTGPDPHPPVDLVDDEEVTAAAAAPGRTIPTLLASVDAQGERTALIVAELLVGNGRVQEAIGILQARADANDEYAAWKLADLLVRNGRVQEAIAILQARADAGREYASWQLAVLRAEWISARSDPPRQPAPETVATASAHHRSAETTPQRSWVPGGTEGGPAPLRLAAPMVLYDGTGAIVTTEFFESEGIRYPIAELASIERVETGGLLHGRTFELWGWFRGSQVRILVSHDAREFGQICRALTRARELGS